MKLRLDGVGLDHPGHPAVLADVTLDIRAGERIALVGPSGAGKSSLLKLLATALRPTRGLLEHDGRALLSLPPSDLRQARCRIGYMPQASALPPRQRVGTAVSAGRLGRWSAVKSVTNLLRLQDRADIVGLLASLGIPDKIDMACDELSGGQLQRVALARVMYQAPNLILLDEPVSALDPALARQAIATLCAHADSQGATLVASLHITELAAEFFDRVIGLRDGRVYFDTQAKELSSATLQELYSPAGARPAC